MNKTRLFWVKNYTMCVFEQLLFGSGLDQFWSYQESFLVVILNPIDLSLSWIRECGVPFFPFHFSILSTKSVWVKILPVIHFSPNIHFSFCFIAFCVTKILKFKLSNQFREFGGKMIIFGILDSSSSLIESKHVILPRKSNKNIYNFHGWL